MIDLLPSLYITLIVLIGVGSSYFLSEAAITAVMTMIGGALVALINMMNGIAGTAEEPEKPEFKVIQTLIEKFVMQFAFVSKDFLSELLFLQKTLMNMHLKLPSANLIQSLLSVGLAPQIPLNFQVQLASRFASKNAIVWVMALP